MTTDNTEPENYGLSENQDFCHCRHNNKTTKNDRKLQMWNRKLFC